tara:strand:+ start:181 stop:900 length:720 start_codon:yes stop_codon:yes gene_type:complete
VRNKSNPTFSKSIILLLLITNFLTIRSFKKIYPKDLNLFGSQSISKQDVLQNSFLKLPERLIFIDTRSSEKELINNLSLKNISINKQLFPLGLEIYIELREPIGKAVTFEKGKKIYGFIDEEGFFLKKEFTDIAEEKVFTISVNGWNRKYILAISKILKSYKDNRNDLEEININKEGFIELKDKNLNKILLGLDNNKIDLQLNLIKNIKNQLNEDIFQKEIKSLDLTEPNYPKIKVFKP